MYGLNMYGQTNSALGSKQENKESLNLQKWTQQNGYLTEAHSGSRQNKELRCFNNRTNDNSPH